jgi:lipopolysaccharide export system protein LptA
VKAIFPVTNAGVAGAILVLLFTSRLVAQSAARGDGAVPFRVPIFDRDHRAVALLNGVALVNGTAVKPVGNQVPLATVRLDYFDGQGGTNLTILGTNCVYDLKQQTAASPDRLRLLTGDGRLTLEGRNWFWWQTNYDLVISNDVVTLVQMRAEPVPMRITGDSCWLRYASNVVTYTGHVRAVDARLDLTCQTLTIQRGTNGARQTIEADGDVVLVNRQGGGQAVCQQAVFTEDGDERIAELLGSPRWTDGARSGRADRFIMDQGRHTLLALGQAQMRLPRHEAGAGSLLMLATAETLAKATNAFIEVEAERLTLQFPATNGPVQSVLAETNVVLRDTLDGSVARAARARYTDAGDGELTGDPEWTGHGARLTAGRLAFRSLPPMFDARPDARLRLPVTALRQSLAGPTAGTNRVAPTNLFLEITGDFLAYRDGWLRSGDRVHVDCFEATNRLGQLDCAALAVKYGQHVEALEASGGVAAEEFPRARGTRGLVARRLHCATAAAGFDDTGRLTRLGLDGKVVGEQEERATNRPAIVKRLLCDHVVAQMGASNPVESATAVGNVELAQGARSVTADRVEYGGGDQTFTFTGHLGLNAPEGRSTNLQSLVYDWASGGYRAVGPSHTVWKDLPRGINLTNLLKPK